MEYRKLGGSGFKVPALTFGTGTFGGKGEFFSAWGDSDVAEASRLVDICLEAGVTMFDTADIYSSGASEEVLGGAIKGRRNKVLSDDTFAVRRSEDDDTLLTVGKAYNGLTDAEIATLTERLRELTERKFGRYHAVRPEIVLEVTFDYVQESKRHKAGYALRFPRIVRVRRDKGPGDADTLEKVRTLAATTPAGARGDDAVGEDGHE